MAKTVKTWGNILITGKEFKEAVREETIKSTGRSALEMAATSIALVTLGAKSVSASWHKTVVGEAAREGRLVDTVQFKGAASEAMINLVDDLIVKAKDLIAEDVLDVPLQEITLAKFQQKVKNYISLFGSTEDEAAVEIAKVFVVKA